MDNRYFQAADIVTTPQLGKIAVDIYNTEMQIRAAGYTKTCNKDHYGYTIWKYCDIKEKPYHHQQYAILITTP